MSDTRLPAPLAEALNTLAIALNAALLVLILRGIYQGVVALIVGGRWEWLSLFSTSLGGSSALGVEARIAVAGTPAMLSILAGGVGVTVFEMEQIRKRPDLRLFILYFTSYSLFTGFAPLFADPLIYRTGEHLADWQLVVGLLGGDWMIRAAISLIGGAGIVRSFSWLSQSILHFGHFDGDSLSRTHLARTLLLVPYLGVNVILSALAFRQPPGSMTIWTTVLECWLESLEFFFCFFLVVYTMKQIPWPSDLTPLPRRILLPWVVGSLGGIAVVAVILLPQIHLG